MSDSLAPWTTHAAPFTAVVSAVTDWDAPSPCEEWTASGVVGHVIDTQRGFLADQGHELPASTGDDPAQRWTQHEAAVRELLADPAIGDKSYDGHFGPTTIGQTLSQFYGFDLLVHRWDIASSQGRHEALTDAELSQIETSVESWGKHAYAPGIFARPVEVGEDADRQTRVLASTGRAAVTV